MKKSYLFAAAALALAGCADGDYVGKDPEGIVNKNDAILFQSTKGVMTRGDIYGSAAADILGRNFIVEGTKGTLPASTTTTGVVFDNYLVTFGENTAGTTETNSNNWEYVGVSSSTQVDNVNTLLSRTVDQQTIKYWDYSVPQYDFVAYSTGNKKMVNTTPTAGQVQVTKIDDTNKNYSFTGLSAADLSQVYITDVVTVEQAQYGLPVVLKFKNLTSKVRMAIYETVPGYSVKSVEFYADNTIATPAVYASATLPADQSELDAANATNQLYTEAAGVYTAYTTYDAGVTVVYTKTSDATTDPTATSTATLFTPDTNPLPTSGTIAVTYPHVGTNNLNASPKPEDYNKAQVTVTPGTGAGSTSSTQTFNALATGTMKTAEHKEDDGSNSIYLGRASNEPTFAGALADNYYQAVIPNPAGQTLTLRVNYTLVSTDGSKEEIKVWGAKAIVPATYTKWQPNYAYTYIFKISDKSNGSTEKLGGIENLFPITFDAVVAQVTDANAEQTTITTVATPSITTYQKGHKYNDTNSYLASKGLIYVMVQNDNGDPANDLDSKGALYTVEKNGDAEISEATVMDALLKTVTGSATVNGRNGISLTTATVNHGSSYVGIDGNTVTVGANSVDNFTPATGTYAYVYTATASTETINVYQPKPVEVGTTSVDGLKSITYTTIANTTDLAANETADKDYLYFQVTKNGAGTEIYYSYITVVPGKTTVVATEGVKKIAKNSLTDATGTAAASTFYFDTYNENNGIYGVKVIKVQ